MSGKQDDFSISVGDDLLAEALEAVEKRLYSKEGEEAGSEEGEGISLQVGDEDDIEIDLSELDLGLDEDEDEEDSGENLLREQLKKALKQNAELEAKTRDFKDESRRLAMKVNRLSEANAQLKLDVRDGKENLETWQEMVGSLKAAAKEYESNQSSLRAKHKRDLEDAGSQGLAKSLKALLTPIDHIELSFEHLDMEIKKDTPIHGLKMSILELQKALKKIKLVKVKAKPGATFDPEIHEAIARAPHDKIKANQIIEVHRSGYTFEKRLLRAAQVSVSSGPESNEE